MMAEETHSSKARIAIFFMLAIVLVLASSGGSIFFAQTAYAANTLTVKGYALDGRPLNMWITISQSGTTVKTGFTPLTFAGTTGSVYSVQAHDYSAGNIVFDHWEDGSTVRTRSVTLSSDVNITALYKTPNRPPVATNDSASVNQDSSVAIGVLSNDSDPDGNLLSVSSVTTPPHGSVATNSNGTVTYTPIAKFNGQDSFSYTISDGNGGSASATVNIQVNLVNYPPVALSQNVSTNEDISLPITLGATDANGDLVTFSAVSQPSHGSLSPASGNGTFTYLPATDYNGQDSFMFKANDGTADSNVATVTIAVASVNDPPVASSQTVSGSEDSIVPITLSASDVDGDPLSFFVVGNPLHGSLSGAAPNLTYTPDPNYNGQDSFTFTANDGKLNSNSGNVTINVSAVNDAPVALSGNGVATNEDAAKNLLLNATDVDGDTLTYTITQNAVHGTLTPMSGSGGNGFTYMPSANYNGQDSFAFKANDGNLDSNIATIAINVSPVNDPPLAKNDSATTNQDTAVTINALANDTDVDGDVMKTVSTTTPAHGSASIAADGSNTIIYKPAAGFYGVDSFSYTISDGNGGTGTATVSITVKFVPSTYTLSINSVDMYGKPAGGLYTVISKSGSTVKTGFTPLAFTGSAGATYSVTISDYASTLFDHWQDNGSTTRAKSLVLNANTTATAMFRVPTLTLSPTSGVGGADITASGTYFTPNNTVMNVTYDGKVVAGTISTNAAGAFTASFKAPSLGTGLHTVQAIDAKGWKASTKFQDTTPPPPHPLRYLIPKNGIYVALYMYPDNGAGAVEWQKVYDQKMAHPKVPIVAAFNPSSGPGSTKDTNIANWVAKLKSAGVIMIGYTYDNYGARPLTELKADADKYKNWYNADGLFIDEFTNKVGYETHYKDLTTYAKSIGLKMTMGNPGTDVPKSYVGTVDVLNITEGPGYMPISWLQYCVNCTADQGWHNQFDSLYFSYTRYNIPSLDTTFEVNSSQWAGLLYITDGTDADGRWFHLPSYFGTEVATLDR